MIRRRPDDEYTARLAAELAGITYRQLDHWARQGWVQPSIDAGLGRAGRRVYGTADVVRLAALGRFGRAGLDVGRLGPVLAELEIPLGEDFLVTATADGDVELVDARDLRAALCQPVLRVVYDPAELAATLGVRRSTGTPARLHCVEASA